LVLDCIFMLPSTKSYSRVKTISGPTLNKKWDAHGKKFDKYWNQISKAHKNTIMKSLSDWQDYYLSEANYDKWLQTDLRKWNKALRLSKKLLAGAVRKANAKPVEPVVTTPTKKIDIKEPVYIYGKVDKTKDNRAWIVGIVLGLMAAYNM